MTKKRTNPRQSRQKNYCFIVEGCTEENYLKLLKKLYHHHKVDKLQNCNGGNAKGVLEKAKRFISKYGNEYLGYVVWFDQDRYLPSDANLKNSLEAESTVEIYLSEPCIEHWLLAHFQPINLLEDNSCYFYEKKLKNHIPHYNKNDCTLLNKYIHKENVESAMTHYPICGKIPQKYFIND